MGAPGRRFPLLPRPNNSDKSNFGHALLVAGSRRMTGAAVLAATATLRCGAGLVTLAAPESLSGTLRRVLPPEVMLYPAAETREGSIASPALPALLKFMRARRVNALAVGPGLSTHPDTLRFVRRLAASADCPMVLDADGLNAFAGRVKELSRVFPGPVLTPHRREWERLFGGRCPDAPADRASLAKQTARRYHGVLVLKGHRTVVAARGRVFVNSTGNPGLAKGGAGDVLTGMLAAFLAQALVPFEAAAWAVYFHGRSADLAVKKTGELGLTASDVIAFLPRAFGGRIRV